MFILDRRWTLNLGDPDEQYLRTIVELGALNQRRFQLSDYFEASSKRDALSFDERTVLSVALTIGLRLIARDLEKVVGSPLDIEHDDPQGAPGGPEPRG